MKIALTSDVHSQDGSKLITDPGDVDLYVLAGDIGDPYLIREKMKEIKVPVAYLPGNHEYYGSSFEIIGVDVFTNTDNCYNNHTIEIAGRRVHMCTLWSHLIGPAQHSLYTNGLNDVNWIEGWDSHQQNLEHLNSVEWLWDVVKEGDIVMTHHSPSFKGVVSQYIGDPYNCCFHTDLEALMRDKKPALWGHGHIHNPVDYQVGQTRVVANPYGYVKERAILDSKHGPYEAKILEV